MTQLEFIEQIIKEKEAVILDANDKIWSYAELPYEETRSSALLCSILESEGLRWKQAWRRSRQPLWPVTWLEPGNQ